MSTFPTYTRSFRGFEIEENDWYFRRNELTAFGGGAGGTGVCVPWEAEIIDDRSEGAPNPDWKLSLNIGTINNYVNPNWDTLIDLPAAPTQAELPQRYIIFDVTLTSGAVSGLTYSVSATLPSPSAAFPVSENAIPTSISLVVGVINGGNVCMLYHDNLQLLPTEAFKEDSGNAEKLTPPYTIYWTLKVTTVSNGDG